MPAHLVYASSPARHPCGLQWRGLQWRGLLLPHRLPGRSHPPHRCRRTGRLGRCLLRLRTGLPPQRAPAPAASPAGPVPRPRDRPAPEPLALLRPRNRPLPLPRLSGGEAGGTAAIGKPESKSGVMQMAGRPPLSSLVRVSAPGGRVGKLGILKADADVPSHYRTDPARFTKLAEDPDHAGQVSEKTRAEAMAGLETEHQKLVIGKITRGGKGIEFHDAAGTPYDVKTPISPPVGAKWPFPTQKAAASIIDELRKKVQSPLGMPLVLQVNT